MSNSDSIVKFCKKCQSETECYANGQCKPCARVRTNARYKANPEKVKAAAKTATAAWRAANADRVKARAAAWWAANPERNAANAAAWQAANPEAKRIINQNRRAKGRAAGGKLSRGLSKKLLKLQRGKCACCGLPLGDNYHIDHIMPLALGGSNADENIQLLAARCNMQKSAKHPVDFMQERGFLL